VSKIARILEVQESNVRWHLKKLMNDRLVGANEDGKAIYFPLNMIRPEDTRIFKLLALDKTTAIFELIKDRDGINLNELSRELDINMRTLMRHTSQLEAIGMIKSTDDGGIKRFFMTDLLSELDKYYRTSSQDFKEYVLRRARLDGLKPKILMSSPGLLKFKIETGIEKKVVTIPIIPYNGYARKMERI
jgi:DNA-binding transcriptional ArsR family regulator